MLRQLLVIALCFTVCESAVLMRFINTVPCRFTTESVATTTLNARLNQQNAGNGAHVNVDRVGLHYFATTGNNVVSSPSLVWTQILENDEITQMQAAAGGALAPYAWTFAMPPLRGYHTQKAAGATETAAIDKPLSPSEQTANSNVPTDQFDILEQTRLKADGVGLYLSFAAGTYRMEAYGVAVSTATPTPASPHTLLDKSFSESGAKFTFVDNMVYTLIATGNGQWAAQQVGSSVSLVLIQESVAPVQTFGMASLRWFHGIQSQSASAIDVYNGAGFSAANKLAAGVAWGTVSNYYDVAPGTIKEFPIATAATGTIAQAIPLASAIPVQHDIRAGMRATIICAITDSTAAQVFCRAIPSRAVAFVRLVHDAVGQESLVQGRFGAQKLSETKLMLSASYEFPRPEESVELSQLQGGVNSGHPATTEGLYPVLVNVAPNSVSGYGEVFVPLFIMDYAVRHTITADYNNERTAAAGTGGFANGGNNDFTQQTWFMFAPVYKRVHLQVNTDGYATMTGRASLAAGAAATADASANGDPFPFVGIEQVGINANTFFTATVTGTHDLKLSVCTDNYMEPGQYYSLFVTANPDMLTRGIFSVPKAGIIRILLRLDRSVAQVSQGISSGNGLLTLIPFAPTQVFQAASAFTLQLSGTSTVPTTTNLATIGVNTAQQLVATNNPTLVADTNTQLTPGSYTWSFNLVNAAPTAVCLNNIPGPGTLTITANSMTDLFVLNTYGCLLRTNDATRLAVTVVTRQSAVASGHSPMGASAATPAASTTTRAVRSYLSIPFYSAAAHSASSSIFALLAALIALVCLAL